MAVEFKDYYEVLGVPKTATDDEIRKKYRKLARKLHPDVNPGDKSAENKFKELGEAYEVLSDPAKRKRYDQLGRNPAEGAGFSPSAGGANGGGEYSDLGADAPGRGDFSEFFESVFGGSRARRRAGAGFRMRGQDIEAAIALTLEDAHRASSHSITLAANAICPECGGTGTKDGKTCPTCQGVGTVRRPKVLDVKIPQGVRDGSVIRLAGQGEPGSEGAPAGDLFLHIRIQPHHLFEIIDDDDVQVELPIAPWEAALGAKVAVPTLDGSVEMTIPANSQGGQRLRLRGKGLQRRDGGRGDEYAKLKIVIPPNATEAEKELFGKLAAESRFNARDLMPGGTS